jgi:GAF domain-containing protein
MNFRTRLPLPPWSVSSDPDNGNQLSALRERMLNILLLGASGLGFAAYFLGARNAIAQQNWGLFLLYTGGYGVILLITFFRQIPYPLRVAVLAGLLYAFGTYSTLTGGLASDGRVWLIGFSSLIAIFINPQISIGTSLLSTGTLLLSGWLLNEGLLPLRDGNLTPLESWLSSSLIFLIINLIISGTLGILVGQLSNRLESERDMREELEFDRQELREKTTDLERRHVQLRTAAEISQAIGSELDPDTIFQQTISLLSERFDLYYAGVFVLDERGQYAVLRAGSGEAGKAMLEEGHRLIVGGNSMIGQSIATEQPQIALDVGEEAVHFDNPHLPETRSELALPMISRGQVRGALTIQSMKEDAFDTEDITILQTIADSLATALENAELYQQSQSSLSEISTLHRQYLQEAWETVTSQREQLEIVYESPQAPAPDQTLSTIEVPLTLRDQQIGTVTLETENPDLTAEEQAALRAITTQAALALENARLIEETQKRSQQERIVSDVTAKVQRAVRVDEALKITLQELGETLGASRGTIQLEIQE